MPVDNNNTQFTILNKIILSMGKESKLGPLLIFNFTAKISLYTPL